MNKENNNKQYAPEWTSITVTKATLRWVSNIKSLLEYFRKRKMTNDEALLNICAIADHAIAVTNGLTNEDFETFAEKKFKEFLGANTEEEMQILLDDMRSFGLFRGESVNAKK